MQKLKKGFTLIELLVVIAIIAILATVVIINVTGARAKSQVAKAKELTASVSKIASACLAFNGTVGGPTSLTAGGGLICSTAPTGGDLADSAGSYLGSWPDINTPTGFSYTTPTITATTFVFTATKTGATTISCSNNGCQ